MPVVVDIIRSEFNNEGTLLSESCVEKLIIYPDCTGVTSYAMNEF